MQEKSALKYIKSILIRLNLILAVSVKSDYLNIFVSRSKLNVQILHVSKQLFEAKTLNKVLWDLLIKYIETCLYSLVQNIILP